MLTLITPTGDRPEAFALCERWIANQTYTGKYRWLVTDDGITPTTFSNKAIEYIRLEPVNGNTQARNLRKALELVDRKDKIVFIEDDDYYAPSWLDVVNSKLDTYDLVGEKKSLYWHVQTRKFAFTGGDLHASLCATALKNNALEVIKQEVKTDGVTAIDHRLWRLFKGKKDLFRGNLVVGIKGLPGRTGIGAGHRKERKFLKQFDEDGKVLKSLIGKDAEVYLNDSFRSV
jgi:hypothetical protein